MAAVSSETNRMSFTPAWMKSSHPNNNGGSQGGGGGGANSPQDPPNPQRQLSSGATTTTSTSHHYYPQQHLDELANQPIAPPKLADHRYGREEMLALDPGGGGVEAEQLPPPIILQHDFQEFFIERHQSPVCVTEHTENEMRHLHQGGINSSKALSNYTHSERQQMLASAFGVAAANAAAAPPPPPALGAPSPFQPSWAGRGASRGGNSSLRGGRGGGYMSDLGSRYGGGPPSLRGRGGGSMGDRGGGGTRGRGRGEVISGPPAEFSINPRAQGLYDPRDPRDRPRQTRLRSNGDGGYDTGGGGSSKPYWANTRIGGRSQTNDGMPEWMDDGDEADPEPPRRRTTDSDEPTQTAEAQADTIAETPASVDVDHRKGSFDEGGIFRLSTNKEPLEEAPTPAVVKPPPPVVEQTNPPETTAETTTSVSSVSLSGPLGSNAGERKAIIERLARMELSAQQQNAEDGFGIVKSMVESVVEDEPKSQPQRRYRPMAMNSVLPPALQVYQTPQPQTTQFPSTLVDQQRQQQQLQQQQRAVELQQQNEQAKLLLQQQQNVATSQGNHFNLMQKTATALAAAARPPAQQIGVQQQNLTDGRWYYKDPRGRTQGPFSFEQMSHWFQQGYFQLNLEVLQESWPDFISLADLVAKFGRVPFAKSDDNGSSGKQPSQNGGSQGFAKNGGGIWGDDNPISDTSVLRAQMEEQRKREMEAMRLAEQERIRKQLEEEQRLAEVRRQEAEAAERLRRQREETERRAVEERERQQRLIDEDNERQQRIAIAAAEQQRRKGELMGHDVRPDEEERLRQQQQQLEQQRRLEEESRIKEAERRRQEENEKRIKVERERAATEERRQRQELELAAEYERKQREHAETVRAERQRRTATANENAWKSEAAPAEGRLNWQMSYGGAQTTSSKQKKGWGAGPEQVQQEVASVRPVSPFYALNQTWLVSDRQRSSAIVSDRQRSSAIVSDRQRSSAIVSDRQRFFQKGPCRNV